MDLYTQATLSQLRTACNAIYCTKDAAIVHVFREKVVYASVGLYY